MSPPKIGVVVNPFAGLGGPVGLKGSDGDAVRREAMRRGATQRSTARARQALETLSLRAPDCWVLAVSGPLGGDAIPPTPRATVLPGYGGFPTTADDTRRACAELGAHGIDLLLFAGGDGTARDVMDAVPLRCPVLGIPTGVKMYSAVFAASPVTAGHMAAEFLLGRARHAPAEVLDLDEDGVRAGVVHPRLYGALSVPRLPGLQGSKVGSAPVEAAGADALADAALRGMNDADVLVLGAGTTVDAVARRLGVVGTLTGVDVVDLTTGRMAARDVGEKELLAAVRGRRCRVVLCPLGGQGFLLGRGVQQISPAVWREVGAEALTILATTPKLGALEGAPLWVDTGDPGVDAELSGIHRVHTGPGEYMMYPVMSADTAWSSGVRSR